MAETITKTAPQVKVKELDLTNLPKLPKTLDALQFLRTAKGKSDSEINTALSNAFVECKKNNMELMLERIMIHIGDVSRLHNVLKAIGIKSPTGGAQERKVFRSCMRWWEQNMPESFIKSLHMFVEFTVYENLMFYENKTTKDTGKLLETEILFPVHKNVWNFLSTQIRTGKDLSLIARHLPKAYSENSSSRTTKFKIKFKKAQKEYNYTVPDKKAWVKLNGEKVEAGKVISLKEGDIVSYPRKKQNFTIKREKYINKWIVGFYETMGWDLTAYKKFKSQQGTPEQLFSSKAISKYSKIEFMKFLDRLTSGQRFRVAKMIAYKDGNTLHPKPKWNDLGVWYIEWEKNQEKVADELRNLAASGGDEAKKDELMKIFKVKATGLQTIDLLAEMLKGGSSDTQVNNTYQALIEKMDLIANIFPIMDGSGSMDSGIVHNGISLRNRDIAYAMCIAFSTRNPVPEFQNTYGWFSNHFEICGRSVFKNESPNRYVDQKKFTKEIPDRQVISPGKTFTQNLQALKEADPQHVSNTNMFASIEYFVKLVTSGKMHVESLPSALLYITDNENNSGKSPSEAMALANSIGWHPLLIFWGLTAMNHSIKDQFRTLPNALFIGGFNESCLSQILRGIKTGSINPETELWSIYNDIRYSVIQ